LVLLFIFIFLLSAGFLIFSNNNRNVGGSNANIPGKIETSQLFFNFENKKFLPTKILRLDEAIYALSPASQDLYKISESKNSDVTRIPQNFDLAQSTNDSILFFKKPNTLIILKNGVFLVPITLLPYSTATDFSDFATFYSNLYFLDKVHNEIIKYPYIKNLIWDSPIVWLNSATKKLTNPISMTANGNIWTINSNYEIDSYYNGVWQETLKINATPALQKPSKILSIPETSNLYILDPLQKRILITSKFGEVKKQIFSEKFNNLLDFAVSQDGKFIYLLNNLQIYKIPLEN